MDVVEGVDSFLEKEEELGLDTKRDTQYSIRPSVFSSVWHSIKLCKAANRAMVNGIDKLVI